MTLFLYGYMVWLHRNLCSFFLFQKFLPLDPIPQVTMADREAAERAVKDANPIIDGRKANVNLAYLGAKPRSNTTSNGELLSLFPFHLFLQQTIAHDRGELELLVLDLEVEQTTRDEGEGEASKREKGIQRDPFRVTHSKYQTWLVYKENHSTCKGNRVAITTREGLFLRNTVLYIASHQTLTFPVYLVMNDEDISRINVSGGWERAWTSVRKARDETMPSMPSMPWGWAVEWG